MIKLIVGAILGFSAGTFAGIKAANNVSTLKVHKELTHQFEINHKDSTIVEEVEHAEAQP